MIYGRLSQSAGAKGYCFPHVQTLAKWLGMSTRQVHRYLKDLQDLGLIEVASGKTKHTHSKYYFLDHPWREDGQEDFEETPINSEYDGSVVQNTRSRTTDMSIAYDGSVTRRMTDLSHVKESIKKIQKKRLSEGPTPKGLDQAQVRPEPKGSTRAPTPHNPTPAKSFADKPAAAGVSQRTLDVITAEAGVRAKARRTKALKKTRQREEKLSNLAGGLTGREMAKMITRVEAVWREEMAGAFPDVPVAKWDVKQRSQAKGVIEKYNTVLTIGAVRYVVRAWSTVSERYLGGKGDYPTMGLVLRLHERLVPASKAWSKYAGAIEEWDRWWAENPNRAFPPADLKERYTEAVEALKKRGTSS